MGGLGALAVLSAFYVRFRGGPTLGDGGGALRSRAEAPRRIRRRRKPQGAGADTAGAVGVSFQRGSRADMAADSR